MQHPAHTNYNHENASLDPKQTNYKGWKTKRNKTKPKQKIIKVHYIIIIIFIFYFLQKHLQHRLQKKKRKKERSGVGVVCL